MAKLDWRRARYRDTSEPGYKEQRLDQAANNWIDHGSLDKRPRDAAKREPSKINTTIKRAARGRLCSLCGVAYTETDDCSDPESVTYKWEHTCTGYGEILAAWRREKTLMINRR